MFDFLLFFSRGFDNSNLCVDTNLRSKQKSVDHTNERKSRRVNATDMFGLSVGRHLDSWSMSTWTCQLVRRTNWNETTLQRARRRRTEPDRFSSGRCRENVPASWQSVKRESERDTDEILTTKFDELCHESENRPGDRKSSRQRWSLTKRVAEDLEIVGALSFWNSSRSNVSLRHR